MRNPSRLLSILGVAATVLAVTASPALAAAPANDTFAGTEVIGSLPFDATVDTTQATTDADDAAANADCGAPATDASVWYSFTPATDGGRVIDVSGSDYSAGVIVVSGTQGGFTLETCGPGTVAFSATAGVTYHVLLFDDQGDGSGNGGTLRLSVIDAPPPPSISMTVDPRAVFNSHTGEATVTGTELCTGVADFAIVDVTLSQKVGRVATVQGENATDIACDGAAHPWSVVITPFSGQFRGGKAASVSIAFACGAFECSSDFQEHQVQLSRR
jgi:hypothetical protein